MCDIVGLISVYNPTKQIVDNIIGLLPYLEKWIILDDSDPTFITDNKLSSLQSSKVSYHRNNKNLGLARTLNYGIGEAIDMGAKWIMIMDSDSSFSTDVISVYKDYISSNEVMQVALLAPQHNYSRHIRKPDVGIRYRRKVMLSGALLNVSVIAQIGLFDERFYIDGLDYEWCQRAFTRGYKIIECQEAVIDHNPGIEKQARLFGKILFRYGWDKPERYYYQFRAMHLLHDIYHDFKLDISLLFKPIKAFLLFDNRGAYLRAWKKSIYDFKNDYFGKYSQDCDEDMMYENVLRENRAYLVNQKKDSKKFIRSAGYFFAMLGKKNYREAFDHLKTKIIHLYIRFKSKDKKRKNITYGTVYKGERIAVYTVLFGTRDDIREPHIIDDNCDYYILTDNEISPTSVWKKIDIPDEVNALQDNILKSRYCKIRSHLFWKEYKYSVYLDANIELFGKPSELIKHIDHRTGIALHNLPYKSSVYEEINALELVRPQDWPVIKQQKECYKQEGFDGGSDMFECNVIVRENSNICCEIMEKWWEDFKAFPKRDQVSFPHALWSLGIDSNEIGIIGNNVRLNPFFRISEH
ncbi:glycosyl transferase GT2 family [Butyrivibrio proteoclasticus B316]|uniref:Glycosyl transferase GT2 family n=1 Tax=Butyrivibrio proteoclasticus (strain ATCC 51982 / DSM 14932 / B316) TaxID=515622 RepID=E0S0Y1_BUTPB|nr:glycosyltransferase domain-containing protein [Butyrivibrio proteoclasticus]ADL33456.1 glycosyl transferase GT2 family [Butyrivibrio proteoclasticus B316]